MESRREVEAEIPNWLVKKAEDLSKETQRDFREVLSELVVKWLKKKGTRLSKH